MSESALPEIRELANAAPAPAPAIVVVNAGALIRAERERQGLHIAALAFTLKVPQAKLEALEANRFDLLSDTVFLRALASSICRILKIDANLILSNLPKPAVQAMNTSPASLNTPFQSGRVQFFDKLKIVVTKPWGIGVLLMLLLILATLFLPSISSFGDLSPVPSSTQAPLASPTLASSEPLAPQQFSVCTSTARSRFSRY
jgi:cytoskeleton protein RodZ